MTNNNASQFVEILHEELEAQLPDGYPCNVPKNLLIKDIEEIVMSAMHRWAIESE